MANPLWMLFLIIGLIFGFLGSLTAYLITYNEYIHHFKSKKEPRKIALEAAIFAFVFFLLLLLIAGYFLIADFKEGI